MQRSNDAPERGLPRSDRKARKRDTFDDGTCLIRVGQALRVRCRKVNDETGKRTPVDVSEGDEVLYAKYGGTEITVDGEDLLVLRESDVLAKVAG